MRRPSFPNLKVYRCCPQQWKLNYVDRLSKALKPFFNRETAVHAAVEASFPEVHRDARVRV